MTEQEKKALYNLFITQSPFTDTGFDAFSLTELLGRTSADDIFDVIKNNCGSLLKVVSNNIPQFSNAGDIYQVLRVVIDSEIDNLTYENIGYYLCPKGAKIGAQVKYGENHYKLSAQLGLVTYAKPFVATDLGIAYYLTDNSTERRNIEKRLALRIPIIQQALLLADDKTVNMADFMCLFLSPSTMLRRRSNLRELLSYIMDISEVSMQHRLNNITWG